MLLSYYNNPHITSWSLFFRHINRRDVQLFRLHCKFFLSLVSCIHSTVRSFIFQTRAHAKIYIFFMQIKLKSYVNMFFCVEVDNHRYGYIYIYKYIFINLCMKMLCLQHNLGISMELDAPQLTIIFLYVQNPLWKINRPII